MHLEIVPGTMLRKRPAAIMLLLIGVFLAAYAVNLTPAFLGPMLHAAIGEPAGDVPFDRIVTSFCVALLVGANVFLVSLLRFKWQMAVVWAELFVAFMCFFIAFDLDLEFIRSKVFVLITQGLTTTLFISAVSISFAFAIALIGAIAKLSNNGFACGIATFYTSLFRGMPLLVQLYLIYIGLPQVGFVIGTVAAGVAALALCYGAYMTEIFRAGIQSIPKGQWEAARALGLSPGVTMFRIILPQAIPLIIPATGNQFIAMVKDSSLISVVGVWEMMFLARTLGQRTFNHMEMLITVSLIYWGISMLLELLQSRIEAHFRIRSAH